MSAHSLKFKQKSKQYNACPENTLFSYRKWDTGGWYAVHGVTQVTARISG